MREIVGDLWAQRGWKVIPTNGVVGGNGQAVMGKGVALQAAVRFPELPQRLGRLLKERGNRVFVHWELGLFTFPTKQNWRDTSNLGLVAESALQLRQVADALPIDLVFLPRVGCGEGGLKWEEVRAVLEKHLDDRFVIVTRKEKH